MKTRDFAGFKKGVNLGGWLSQCVGGNYTDEYYSTFITKEDVDRIASWGCDHVRLPIDYNVIQTDDGDMIDYLIENYRIHVDKTRYTVMYEYYGSNLKPSITVLENEKD